MPFRALRKAILCSAALALGASLPGVASAGGSVFAVGDGRYVPAYGGGTAGYRLYGHPLDDSYDPPFGYGEYAEYGPWVSRGYVACQFVPQRLRTVNGPRWRTIRVCG